MTIRRGYAESFDILPTAEMVIRDGMPADDDYYGGLPVDVENTRPTDSIYK